MKKINTSCLFVAILLATAVCTDVGARTKNSQQRNAYTNALFKTIRSESPISPE